MFVDIAWGLGFQGIHHQTVEETRVASAKWGLFTDEGRVKQVG